MSQKKLSSYIFTIFIIMTIVLSLLLFRAPRPQSKDLSLTEFSAEKAFVHTNAIFSKPHMTGSVEHERVKDYIIKELENLGLETSVQKTTAITSRKGRSTSAYIQNVIGVLKGTDKTGKSILIIGHYDTQPNTPGAADDGSAVAAMLESARALKEYRKLKNDIIFVFTDAEEIGLLGAKAFVEDHELTGNAGLVLNIEARGNAGPSIIFELSAENGWIVKELKKAMPHTIAHSLAYEVYKVLPNATDFTEFKKASLSGLNAAIVDGFVNYHSMTDSPENLSMRSLQHHGEYALNIAKHFGNLDLTQTKADDVVFFNIVGYVMIIYPMGLNIILIIAITILFILYWIIGIRKNQINILKTIVSVVVFIVAISLSFGIVWLLRKAVLNIYPHYSIYYYSNFYNIKYYFIAFAAIALAVFSFIYTLVDKKLGFENLNAGILCVLTGMMFPLYIYFPSAAYIIIVPLLLILMTKVIGLFLNYSLENSHIKYLSLNLLLLIPVITLYIPLIKIFFITFGLELIFVGVILTLLLAGMALIQMKILHKMKRGLLPGITLSIGVIYLIIGHYTSDYSKYQPLQSNVRYCLNTDTNKAYWVSDFIQTDEWNVQFFDNPDTGLLKEIYPNTRREVLKNETAVIDLAKPEFKILSDTIEGNLRVIKLWLESNRKAEFFEIYIEDIANLTKLKINDKAVNEDLFYKLENIPYYQIKYFGLYNSGCKLTLYCETKEQFRLIVNEIKLGLDSVKNIKEMPDYIIPDKGYTSNQTLARYSWKL